MRQPVWLCLLLLPVLYMANIPALAQSGRSGLLTTRSLPGTLVSSVVGRVQRTVDSLQRLTQPGYYSVLYTNKQATSLATTRSTALATVNPCDNYLCGQIDGEVVSIRIGPWNDPATWSVNRVPTKADVVRLRHIVNLPTNYNAQAKRLHYDAAGALQTASGSQLRVGL